MNDSLLSGKKPIVVTLCGSTRFKQQFVEINAKFTLEGKIVLAPGIFVHTDGQLPELTEDQWAHQKIKLDILHKHKILNSNEIFVINVGGYVGDSTLSEIQFATQYKIPIKWLEDPSEDSEDSDFQMDIEDGEMDIDE